MDKKTKEVYNRVNKELNPKQRFDLHFKLYQDWFKALQEDIKKHTSNPSNASKDNNTDSDENKLCEVCNKTKEDTRFEGSEEKYLCDECLNNIKHGE